MSGCGLIRIFRNVTATSVITV